MTENGIETDQENEEVTLLGQSVRLDFKNPTIEIVNLCISEIQEKLSIIARKRASDRRARLQVQRRGIYQEVELCFAMAKYLIAYNETKPSPGIKYALGKIAMILKDDDELLIKRTTKKKEIAELVRQIRRDPYLQNFLTEYVS